MLEHEPGGGGGGGTTDRRRVPQITAAGMKIQQPGMCSAGGGADHGGCKGGDGGCDRGVSLQRPPEEGVPGVPGGQGSPRAIAGRLSSGSAGKCSSDDDNKRYRYDDDDEVISFILKFFFNVVVYCL